MNKLPLENLETKRIPIGPRIHQQIAKSISKSKAINEVPKPSQFGEQNDKTPDGDLGGAPFGKPSLYTTKKLLKITEEAKNHRHNINEMLENKLASPNTAKYLRKKKASKVTVLESKNIYKDLISLDVSGVTLIKEIEEDMRKRACSVQVPPKPADPEPCLADYFRDEFLNVRTVGPSDIFPLPPPNTPFASDYDTLLQYTDMLLGKDS